MDRDRTHAYLHWIPIACALLSACIVCRASLTCCVLVTTELQACGGEGGLDQRERRGGLGSTRERRRLRSNTRRERTHTQTMSMQQPSISLLAIAPLSPRSSSLLLFASVRLSACVPPLSSSRPSQPRGGNSARATTCGGGVIVRCLVPLSPRALACSIVRSIAAALL